MKLIRVEFIRQKNGEWVSFEKYDNGAEQGGKASKVDVREIIEEMFKNGR